MGRCRRETSPKHDFVTFSAHLSYPDSNAQAGVVDFKRTLARRSGKSTAASLGAGEGLSDGVGWQMRLTWHGSIWWLVAVR